jgi:hypothetical protein
VGVRAADLLLVVDLLPTTDLLLSAESAEPVRNGIFVGVRDLLVAADLLLITDLLLSAESVEAAKVDGVLASVAGP